MYQELLFDILTKYYDIGIKSVSFMREGGSKVYVVEANHGQYLLKLVNEAFFDTFHQSSAVMQYLEEKNFPVPRTILTKDGASTINVFIEDKPYIIALYEYIQGTEPDLTVRATEIGALVGQMHTLLSDYSADLENRNEQFFVGRYLDILKKKNYAHIADYKVLGENLWNHVKNCPTGICHGDLHRGNLLETADGEICVLDFDTVCIAPLMFDVMVMCDMTDYFCLTPSGLETTQAVYANFLAGYIDSRDLTMEEKQSFYAWVAVRHFQLQATIVEIYGLDCIDEKFIDKQLDWLKQWIHMIEGISDVL